MELRGAPWGEFVGPPGGHPIGAINRTKKGKLENEKLLLATDDDADTCRLFTPFNLMCISACLGSLSPN
jgi:hypothetical protein